MRIKHKATATAHVDRPAILPNFNDKDHKLPIRYQTLFKSSSQEFIQKIPPRLRTSSHKSQRNPLKIRVFCQTRWYSNSHQSQPNFNDKDHKLHIRYQTIFKKSSSQKFIQKIPPRLRTPSHKSQRNPLKIRVFGQTRLYSNSHQSQRQRHRKFKA